MSKEISIDSVTFNISELKNDNKNKIAVLTHEFKLFIYFLRFLVRNK